MKNTFVLWFKLKVERHAAEEKFACPAARWRGYAQVWKVGRTLSVLGFPICYRWRRLSARFIMKLLPIKRPQFKCISCKRNWQNLVVGRLYLRETCSGSLPFCLHPYGNELLGSRKEEMRMGKRSVWYRRASERTRDSVFWAIEAAFCWRVRVTDDVVVG